MPASPGHAERDRGQESALGRPLRSLHIRVALWYGAILALCLLAYSLAVGVFFEGHVSRELDRRLHEDIELAARGLVVDDAGRPRWPGDSLGKQIEEEEGGGHWLEVWSPGGERLLATGTMDPLDLGPPGNTARPEHQPRTVEAPRGAVRVMTEILEFSGGRFLVRAAVSESSTRAEVRMVWIELGLLSLGVLVLGGMGGLFLTRSALSPLGRMASHAQRITAEQLHERLPVEESSTELEQLRDSFNDTLARLERSFDQLRRFTADASHELRTPLTALRSVGEMGLRGANSREDYRDVVGSMLEEVDRLSRLADELLTLARAEAGEAKLRPEPLDLGALAREVVEHLSVLAEEREQSIELTVDGAVFVRADRVVLRQALVNLLDNAIKYSPEGTRIQVEAGVNGDCVFVQVRDNGPGIPEEHRERIFERFYRIDKSRSRELGGTGLGLSLVRWAAEAHGGRVAVESEAGRRGSTFRLVLPAAS